MATLEKVDEQKRQEHRQRVRARKMLHESEAPSPGRAAPAETDDPPASPTPRAAGPG